MVFSRNPLSGSHARGMSPGPQEAAFEATASVDVGNQVRPRDRSRRGDANNPPGECSARWVERGEGAVFGPQESVQAGLVDSSDRPLRVDGVGLGQIGARWVERGEGAVFGPQEAVTRDSVTVVSRNRSRRVDGNWGVPLTAVGTAIVVKLPLLARRKATPRPEYVLDSLPPRVGDVAGPPFRGPPVTGVLGGLWRDRNVRWVPARL